MLGVSAALQTQGSHGVPREPSYHALYAQLLATHTHSRSGTSMGALRTRASSAIATSSLLGLLQTAAQPASCLLPSREARTASQCSLWRGSGIVLRYHCPDVVGEPVGAVVGHVHCAFRAAALAVGHVTDDHAAHLRDEWNVRAVGACV